MLLWVVIIVVTPIWLAYEIAHKFYTSRTLRESEQRCYAKTNAHKEKLIFIKNLFEANMSIDDAWEDARKQIEQLGYVPVIPREAYPKVRTLDNEIRIIRVKPSQYESATMNYVHTFISTNRPECMEKFSIKHVASYVRGFYADTVNLIPSDEAINEEYERILIQEGKEKYVRSQNSIQNPPRT